MAFKAMNMMMFLSAARGSHGHHRPSSLVREVEGSLFNVEQCFSKLVRGGKTAPVVNRCLLAHWLNYYGLQPNKVALLTI